ncbi:MAG: hypothetical protein FWD61_18935 [Phycisphaerales bacterium]|nr:hypothetical protein [Phycisphaerales bacterium]
MPTVTAALRLRARGVVQNPRLGGDCPPSAFGSQDATSASAGITKAGGGIEELGGDIDRVGWVASRR